MGKRWDVVIIGSGNAALCAGIAACELGADVLMIEKADRDMAIGIQNIQPALCDFLMRPARIYIPFGKARSSAHSARRF